MGNGIMFEVLPPSKLASENYIAKVTENVVRVVNEIGNVGILNIPEIVEENHIGQPYYRNVDIRKYGNLLEKKTGKEIMINTVVGHYGAERFSRWLDESILNHGIKNFVFVGAKINGMKYLGPSVTEANQIGNNKNIKFGNIFIPNRPEEAERLFAKTKSGCSLFTSQVLFEHDKAAHAINAYLKKCRQHKLNPIKFYLSFAPVSSSEDIEFLKWLGVDISGKTESRLKRSSNMGEESINIIQDLISRIFCSIDDKIGLALNLEYIMLHNLELTKSLAQRISELKITIDS